MFGAFLWSGSLNTHTKTTVAWDDVCKAKAEGGLDIQRLKDMSHVCALCLIWRLLTDSGWVAWTKAYLLRSHSFWDVSDKSVALGSGASC